MTFQNGLLAQNLIYNIMGIDKLYFVYQNFQMCYVCVICFLNNDG